jgi:hypothetical protein
MLTCFKCKKVFNNPTTLFQHHKICGNNCMVQCTLCWKKFSSFSTFKTNVTKCFAAIATIEIPENVDVDPALFAYAVSEEISDFETTMRKATLKLACGLSAKMNWPRQDVFTTISEFKNTFLAKVISGT